MTSGPKAKSRALVFEFFVGVLQFRARLLPPAERHPASRSLDLLSPRSTSIFIVEISPSDPRVTAVAAADEDMAQAVITPEHRNVGAVDLGPVEAAPMLSPQPVSMDYQPT